MKRGKRLCGGLAFCLAPTLLLGACGDQEKPSGNGEVEQSTGMLDISVASELSKHDVAAVQFRVLPSGALCDATALAEKTVALAGVSTDSDGTKNFSTVQTVFVLMPGDYVMCMKPLTSAGAPSCECSGGRSPVVVTAGKTTALSMKSECKGNPTGGISVTGKLDDPPQILDVIVDTSDANPCEQAKLAVKAVDPNGDEPGSVTWSVTGPGSASIDSLSGQAVLRANAAGDYQVTVMVWDGPWGEINTHGTSLTVPVHVSESALAGDTCYVSPVRDTYVRTDLDIRRNDNYGCNPLLEVGSSRGGGGIPEGGADAMRMLLSLPTVLPPGTTAQSAVLEMTVAGYDGTSTFPYTLDVHGNFGEGLFQEGYGVENESIGQKLFDAPFSCVNPDESNGVAWEGGGYNGENNATAPAFDPAVASSATVDPATQGKGTVVRWDITSLFLGWVADPSTNHGITITDVTSNGEFRGIRFGSREQIFGFPAEYTAAAPRLVVKLAR